MPSAESIAMRHDQLNLSVSWVPCDSMHLKMFGFEAANAYTYLMVIKVRAMSKVDEFNRLRLSKVTHTVESVSKRNEGVSVGNPIIDITENEIDGTENGFESNVKRTEESSSFAPIGPIARLPCVVKSKIQKNKNDVDSLCVYEERQRVAVATVRMNGNDDVNKWPRTDASNESPIDLASIEQLWVKFAQWNLYRTTNHPHVPQHFERSIGKGNYRHIQDILTRSKAKVYQSGVYVLISLQSINSKVKLTPEWIILFARTMKWIRRIAWS